MNIIVLAAAILGCSYPSYGYGYSRGYNYNQGYNYYNYTPVQYVQQAVYVPYVEKVKFVAVEQQPVAYYAAMAAAPLRAEERYQEYRAQQPQQTMIYNQPLAQPQQAIYQAPQIPAKATPQVQEQLYAPEKTAPTPQVQGQPYAPEKATPQAMNYGESPEAPYKAAPLPAIQTPPVSSQADTGVPLPPPISEHGLIYGSMDVEEPPSFQPPPIRRSASLEQPRFAPRARQVFSLDQNMVRVLDRNCSTCHTGPRSKGGQVIFNSPGQLASLSKHDLENIYDQILLGQEEPGKGMPKKRTMSGADAAMVLNGLRGFLQSLASR